MSDADGMTLVDQQMAYDSVGKKIKDDLLQGNAVVLFAYGLSGSGKTFTVFGPDAIDAPEAWFKWAEPHKMWGILPCLAYEIFTEKQDGWKISMKYFQNVVDIVRDLMSKSGEERSYKDGMRKDPDGFMDIEWCVSQVVKSWDDFREVFQKANARKAIAPTQFNPMSTRGHCIMVLEVEILMKPSPLLRSVGRILYLGSCWTEPLVILCTLAMRRRLSKMVPSNTSTRDLTRTKRRPRSCRIRARKSILVCLRWRNFS